MILAPNHFLCSDPGPVATVNPVPRSPMPRPASWCPVVTEGRAGATTGIDHRQARRLPVQFPVLLHVSRGLHSYGIARNLSCDGIFVETGVRLDLDCCLDLIVSDSAAAAAGPIVLPALVIHRTNQGLGLIFRALGDSASAAVQRLMEEAQCPSLPSWRADDGGAV